MSRLPIGVGHEGGVELSISPGQVVLVAGPPGSGRSTALATIALEARRRGVTVHTVGAGSPIGACELGSRLAAADEGDEHPPMLVVVDDATDVEDDGRETLSRLIRGRLRHESLGLVIAIDPVERRTRYGHWTAGLRRCDVGIALHHDPDEDRDLWTTVLPPAPVGHPPPGRGLLLRRGHDALEVQVARP